MKYNYVILNNESEYYRIAFSEIRSLDYAIYIDKIELGLFDLIFRIHISKKINSWIWLPFKSVWNRFLIKNKFIDNNPICFVIISNSIWNTLCKYTQLDSYIRKTYPGSKVLLYFTDLVKKTHYLYDDKELDVEDIKRRFDLVLSYDKGDCDHYGFLYYPTPYSAINLKLNSDFPECDVYFLGKAKERLEKIVKVYDDLENIGLRCDFYITGVKKKRIYREHIHYLEKLMPYQENLKRIAKSRAVLEVMQEGATGYTFRLWEALIMRKYLITDNALTNLRQTEFMQVVIPIEKIQDSSFNLLLQEDISIESRVIDSFSPSKFLEKLDNLLD